MSEKKSIKKTENAENTELKEQKVVTRYDRKMERRRKEKERQQKEERLGRLIGFIVVAAVIVFASSFPIRNYIATHKTYIKVNGDDITKVEYDYNYNLALSSYVSQYGSYLSYFGLDVDGDLSTQMYSDELTWKDFFDEYAVSNIKQNKALLAEAEAAGFTYDTADEYAEYKQDLKTAASEAGMTLRKYVKDQYGSYATLGRISEYVKESMVLNAFYSQKQDELAPSDDEIESYYQENKASYDSVDYYIATFEAQLPTEPTELADAEPVYADDGTYTPSDAEIENAMTEAWELAVAGQASVGNNGEEILGSSRSSVSSSDVKEWLFDESRNEGDVTVIEDEDNNCYYTVQFTARYLDNSPTVNARILITDADGSDTLLDTWKAGEATEESFAALCDENSLYTSVEGGLYEELNSSAMDEDLADWLFDESRQYGDTTSIVAYDGYTYIAYFVGNGDPEWKVSIRNTLTSESMSEYLQEISDAVTLEDPNGNLNYLKVEAASAASEETTESTETTAEAETTAQ
jgi:hypothetical protein